MTCCPGAGIDSGQTGRLRLVSMLTLWTNYEWAVAKLYMKLETLSCVT